MIREHQKPKPVSVLETKLACHTLLEEIDCRSCLQRCEVKTADELAPA